MIQANEDFAKRIYPRKFGFSPKLSAIVGAIIGFDYGVRDGRGGKLSSLCITSDGFVTGASTASDGGGAFLGCASDMVRNLQEYLTELSENDRNTFNSLYTANVTKY